MQSVHSASEIGEFSVYYAWFSGKRSVAYDYFIFRRGASFKIFSCNVTPFSLKTLIDISVYYKLYLKLQSYALQLNEPYVFIQNYTLLYTALKSASTLL